MAVRKTVKTFFKKRSPASVAPTAMSQAKTRRRPKSAPARRRPQSRTSMVNFKRNVMKVMDQVSEHKIKPLTSQYNLTPSPQTPPPGTTVVYYQNYILGTQPSDWIGPQGINYVPLEGLSFAQGDGSDQRIGKYLYLKHATVNLRVHCLNLARVACPVRFRVLVYKAKRNGSLNTLPGNPNTDLFLETSGNEVGLLTVANDNNSSMRFMTAITNKKKYQIFKDMQFILQPSLNTVLGTETPVAMSHGIYPAERYFRFQLPLNERAEYDNVTNQPLDGRFQYCISIFSAPSGTHNDRPNDWRSTVTGTISALDN